VVEADISKSTKTRAFSERFPHRFFNVGVAEQNGTMIAAGLATCGKIPFFSTYSVFGTMRACEQVRTFIAYPRLNVKLAFSHGGLTPGNDGPTHQGTEDMGIIRTIPNMTIIMPADAVQTKKAVHAVCEHDGPVFIRLTRDAVPVLYKDEDPFQIGKANTLRTGKDVTVIAIGDMVSKALEAAEILQGKGMSCEVIDMHTLKPLDEEAVLAAACKTRRVVTVEDHNRINGLGSAVAELLSERNPVPVFRIGIPDTFGESGPYEELLRKYGLSTDDIVAACIRIVE
jgi:transketolase